MTTRHDPWVNLLRTTVACFAAGVGGAEVVTVQPFDAALGLPDAFSRRIARNTQSLLIEEGSLARVLDPAGGSWYVEALTDELARAAWAWFTEIERAGGLAAALTSGLVRHRIAEAWSARAERLARPRHRVAQEVGPRQQAEQLAEVRVGVFVLARAGPRPDLLRGEVRHAVGEARVLLVEEGRLCDERVTRHREIFDLRFLICDWPPTAAGPRRAADS
jgi:methylmalonyl-CoA mutase